jgi:NarL family two-component system sensor histidine kinase LiaS
VNGGIFSLRRLRWKLAFSYTLVTVVVLLALELLLVGAIVAFLRSELPAVLLTQQLRNEYASRLEGPLNEDPPDRAALEEELTWFAENSNVRGADRDPQEDPGLGSVVPDEGALFVLDDRRRLVASVPDLRGFREGERFDAAGIPRLDPLVRAAFAGEENSRRLSARTPQGRMLMVVPIDGRGDRVAGVLVGTFRMPNLAGPLLVAVLLSAGALVIPAALLGLLFGFVTAWGLTRRLRRLALAARSWSRGDFSVLVKDHSRDELGQLGRELNRMAREVEGLMQTRSELATLEARGRFARDLHDSVKQQVFATSLQIAAARAMMARDSDAAEGHLKQAEELVRQSQKELNVLIHEMRPAALEGKGLAGALRDSAAEWSGRAEIPIQVHVRGERETPLEVEQALFRVAQEALANVARHSGASRAEVDLLYGPHALTLRVSDDGRGFDASKKNGSGFGLHSMSERLAALGGSLSVESRVGEGTRVTGVCPLPGAQGDGAGNPRERGAAWARR